jgi:selT/selW/selH-like putative selenoprotein
VSLKQELEREFGTPVRIRAGAPGAMDVFVNGEKVYSKKQTGRMPGADELIELLRPKAASG